MHALIWLIIFLLILIWFIIGVKICYSPVKKGRVDDIGEVPAADVQPVKRGRWIIADDVEHFIAVCSECGRTEDIRDIKDMPYCHCGARMMKED